MMEIEPNQVPIQHLKRGDRFRLPMQFDPNKDVYIFDHLDGMYSFSKREKDGHILHWNGPVVLVERAD